MATTSACSLQTSVEIYSWVRYWSGPHAANIDSPSLSNYLPLSWKYGKGPSKYYKLTQFVHHFLMIHPMSYFIEPRFHWFGSRIRKSKKSAQENHGCTIHVCRDFQHIFSYTMSERIWSVFLADHEELTGIKDYSTLWWSNPATGKSDSTRFSQEFPFQTDASESFGFWGLPHFSVLFTPFSIPILEIFPSLRSARGGAAAAAAAAARGHHRHRKLGEEKKHMHFAVRKVMGKSPYMVV